MPVRGDRHGARGDLSERHPARPPLGRAARHFRAGFVRFQWVAAPFLGRRRRTTTRRRIPPLANEGQPAEARRDHRRGQLFCFPNHASRVRHLSRRSPRPSKSSGRHRKRQHNTGVIFCTCYVRVTVNAFHRTSPVAPAIAGLNDRERGSGFGVPLTHGGTGNLDEELRADLRLRSGACALGRERRGDCGGQGQIRRSPGGVARSGARA